MRRHTVVEEVRGRAAGALALAAVASLCLQNPEMVEKRERGCEEEEERTAAILFILFIIIFSFFN